MYLHTLPRGFSHAHLFFFPPQFPSTLSFFTKLRFLFVRCSLPFTASSPAARPPVRPAPVPSGWVPTPTDNGGPGRRQAAAAQHLRTPVPLSALRHSCRACVRADVRTCVCGRIEYTCIPFHSSTLLTHPPRNPHTHPLSLSLSLSLCIPIPIRHPPFHFCVLTPTLPLPISNARIIPSSMSLSRLLRLPASFAPFASFASSVSKSLQNAPFHFFVESDPYQLSSSTNRQLRTGHPTFPLLSPLCLSTSHVSLLFSYSYSLTN